MLTFIKCLQLFLPKKQTLRGYEKIRVFVLGSFITPI
ncbi:hypothetical protein P9853_44 [Streptococcus phage P9853]|uniref:Uncharacterized protein n=1 Tax=Streptococcus phage P9853 TaxID=1971445 RepID=A0A286QT79_9CAUD|nr:hypothetical protein PQF06_gp44 [Streptococcus phage P9853]ARU14644.1 hypothetical protein P9853_44 [Streptococcus phage P9853]